MAMGSAFPFLDILIFAAIAAFLVFRLRNVLGRRDGHQGRPTIDPFRQKPEGEAKGGEEEKVIPLPGRNNQSAEPSNDPDAVEAGAVGGLTQIKLADRAFDEVGFLGGARGAFEMVITAFAEGDTKTLRPLLSNDVYEDFAGAIAGRGERGETLETTLIGVTEAQIAEAELQGKTAFVTVRFVSEQINVSRDSAGEVVDGDPSHVATITDLWTFARNTRSRDPNWTLVATASPT